MSRHQRLNDILGLVAERGRLGVEEAAECLGVSVATVRRDFDHLAQQQLLTRTHGGVVSGAASLDLPLSYKIARNADAKRRIAAAAAAMVPIGSTVALNGGTTTHEVARAIASRPDLASGDGGPSVTVVTNALNIATELAVRPQVKILVVGGVARPQSYELIGPLTAPALEQVWVDIAFLGVDAVDPRRGAMAHHEGEAAVNRELASRAERVVVVADASKLGAAAFALICDSAQLDVLLTDTDPGPDVRAAFREHGVEVVVAGTAAP
ncbi:DeoR/GlpR family DNA-binding transcription regulator [Isoptericola cucumis]|uniref:Transcriptional regulator n=1 Tax=Isoptericola cucumis TaxID=1776856 RepID=A0ABQ2B0Y8_9MICO|nr:DeoR/GlpR family DNA-binding transcription regulator [Isoptericola cucumis]GGI05231.1 transcriptional regulator [Isoptericola cucumis]